jgi:4-amino-4-deoxy-L-arabinose transferase-like glycosyltransferase
MIQRLCLPLVGNAHIALRLPAVVGFCCTVACVYAFVSRRAGCGKALLCALILLSTNLYFTFAVQARPYGMVVAAIAFAMVCYQRVPNPAWTLLLFLSLAFAVSLHYYAVFAIGAFVAAEAACYWRSHKLRMGVWLAIVLGAAPLVAFWPLLHAQKEIYGRNFWAHPKLYGALATYGSFFFLPMFVAIGLVTVLAWFFGGTGRTAAG